MDSQDSTRAGRSQAQRHVDGDAQQQQQHRAPGQRRGQAPRRNAGANDAIDDESAAGEASAALNAGLGARNASARLESVTGDDSASATAPQSGLFAQTIDDDSDPETKRRTSFSTGNSGREGKDVDPLLFAAPPQRQHHLEQAKLHIEKGDEMAASQVPLRLAAIRIEGAKAMRPSFLTRMCRPYVDQSLQDTTLNRLLYAHRLDYVMPGQPAPLPLLLNLLQSVGSDLASLDMFADMSASLEPSKTATAAAAAAASVPGMPARPSLEDVDLVLQCKERPRYFVKTSTDVGNGEGNATIQARIRNVFGGAETADLSALMGTRTRRAYNASLSWPLLGYADHMATVSAFAQDRDLAAFSSATEGIRGVRAALRLSSASAGGLHEIAYDLAHRHLGRLQPTASLSMRRLAGHSIKSSVVHSYTRDTRDDPFMAMSGSLLKVVQEYAGLGGDAQHYRIESETQVSRRFGFGPAPRSDGLSVVGADTAEEGGFGVALAARTGLLASLNGRAPAFSDRFHLGGPTCVRMFRYNSLGPKDGLDALGGDAYFAVGASLFAPPWPGKAHWPLKLHAFVNAGQLVQLHHHSGGKNGDSSSSSSTGFPLLRRNAHTLVADMLGKPSASAGVGLMFRQGTLRAELNVGVPIAVRRGDGARTGVQLGIGLSFL